VSRIQIRDFFFRRIARLTIGQGIRRTHPQKKAYQLVSLSLNYILQFKQNNYSLPFDWNLP
jgi:hypothetical protein